MRQTPWSLEISDLMVKLGVLEIERNTPVQMKAGGISIFSLTRSNYCVYWAVCCPPYYIGLRSYYERGSKNEITYTAQTEACRWLDK